MDASWVVGFQYHIGVSNITEKVCRCGKASLKDRLGTKADTSDQLI